MALSLVLVLAIQLLNLGVLHKRVIHILTALDVQLQIHVALLASALVLHIDALHKVEGMALEQVVDGPLDLSVLRGWRSHSELMLMHTQSTCAQCNNLPDMDMPGRSCGGCSSTSV